MTPHERGLRVVRPETGYGEDPVASDADVVVDKRDHGYARGLDSGVAGVRVAVRGLEDIAKALGFGGERLDCGAEFLDFAFQQPGSRRTTKPVAQAGDPQSSVVVKKNSLGTNLDFGSIRWLPLIG